MHVENVCEVEALWQRLAEALGKHNLNPQLFGQHRLYLDAFKVMSASAVFASIKGHLEVEDVYQVQALWQRLAEVLGKRKLHP